MAVRVGLPLKAETIIRIWLGTPLFLWLDNVTDFLVDALCTAIGTAKCTLGTCHLMQRQDFIPAR